VQVRILSAPTKERFYMEHLILYKFDPLAGQEAPGVTIEITAELPDMNSSKDAESSHDLQARLLVDALRNNLPQGTLFRVLYKLMEHYAKEVLYRGKHGT